jgi:hypothetical protein
MEYSPKNNPTITVGFRPFQSVDLSLTGCSSAEPASVSVQHSKNSNHLVYLQTVKIPSHFQGHTFIENYIRNLHDPEGVAQNPIQKSSAVKKSG